MAARHVSCVFLCLLALLSAPVLAQSIERTYSIRIGDKIVGYQIETETPRTVGERAVVDYRVKSLAKVEILGSSIDQRLEQTWTLDAGTREVLRVESTMDAGTVHATATGERVDAGFSFAAEGAPARIVDPATTVVSPEFRWLLQRGPTDDGKVVELDCLQPEMGGVQKAKVRLVAAERQVDELGKKVLARGWSLELVDVGMAITVFVTADGRTVRYEVPAMDMVVEPAPAAVVERIQRVDLTHTIVCKTNLDLDDPTPLTSMKVRVVADATSGVTVEKLTSPGQQFTGAVANGRVDGVFEIRPKRSDGVDAPPFPPPAGAFAQPELQPFLQPGEGIESDDPAVVAKARELAAGATTCFQVVERLAKWTHENISYAIPGGVTAKRTLELGQGDCGGHSHLLAAMLRSVGIPARTPMGAMYVPLYGGSFGQHMWNEVWLGDSIGWLPVDCTAGQSTFVDASHIRLADGMTAFRPQSVEVLEWEPKSARGPAPSVRRQDAWPWRAGETENWTWRRAGKPLGTERITYEGPGDGGHVFVSSIELGGGRFVESVRTVVGDDGRARSLRVERKVGDATSTIALHVAEGKATVTQKNGEEERTDVIDVEADVFVMHNNCTAHFAIVASRIGELAEGASAKVRFVHDEARTVLGMPLRGGAATETTVGESKITVRVVEATLAGLEIGLHVDEAGRLVRFTQGRGDIVVERADR